MDEGKGKLGYDVTCIGSGTRGHMLPPFLARAPSYTLAIVAIH
jgi:hypothetical protein